MDHGQKSFKKPHWTEISLKTGTEFVQTCISSMEHFVRLIHVHEISTTHVFIFVFSPNV